MINIIGAGPVGTLWALLLRQKGYDVRVFEKRLDPRLQNLAAGRSINLVLTSRGIYGLEKAGLGRLIQQISVPVYGRIIHPKKGETIYYLEPPTDSKMVYLNKQEIVDNFESTCVLV